MASVPEIRGYADLSRVGRGGFSVVYRGQQVTLDRPVAIKVLLADLEEEGQVRRFTNECRILGRLGLHKHVVDVYDAGVTDEGRPYIVMKFYGGGTLADRLKATGSLPAADVVSIGVKMAAALQAAHDIGVIHRDVKPDNVLVDDDGEPVLTDFGVAAVADAAGAYTSSVAFSRAHVAPEVLDRNAFGVASDVYGLGSTMFTLLTGRAAFAADTEARQIIAILNDPAPEIDQPGVPAGLSAVIATAMAKQPEARYATAGLLRQALLDIDLSQMASTEIDEDTGPRPVRPATVLAAPATAAAGVAEDLVDPTRRRTSAPGASVDEEDITVRRATPAQAAHDDAELDAVEATTPRAAAPPLVPVDPVVSVVPLDDHDHDGNGLGPPEPRIPVEIDPLQDDVEVTRPKKAAPVVVVVAAAAAAESKVPAAASPPVPRPATSKQVPAPPPSPAKPEPVHAVAARKSRRAPLAIALIVLAVLLVPIVAFAVIRGSASSQTPAKAVAPAPVSTPSPSERIPPSASPAPTPSVADTAPDVVVPTYATFVNYAPAGVKSAMFPDTLDWQVDLCLGDTGLAQRGYAGRIQLLRKTGGRWKPVGARALVSDGGTADGGRCKKGTVRVEIGTTEPTPPATAVGQGWSTCSAYQLVIPETARFRKTSVGLCVKTKASA